MSHLDLNLIDISNEIKDFKTVDMGNIQLGNSLFHNEKIQLSTEDNLKTQFFNSNSTSCENKSNEQDIKFDTLNEPITETLVI
jgi:hypothetical protein